jgi:hypothetical protein
MSASQAPALKTIAFQLAATLDKYDLTFHSLLKREWPDMDLYQAASATMDELRMYSAAVPTVSVQYITLLIAHAELVHCLWKNAEGPVLQAGELARATDDHRAAIAALRRKCLQLLADGAGARESTR